MRPGDRLSVRITVTEAQRSRSKPDRGMVQTLFDSIFPHGGEDSGSRDTLDALLTKYGFDRVMHEQIREDLRNGRLGLSQNRLPSSTVIEDVSPADLTDTAALTAR